MRSRITTTTTNCAFASYHSGDVVVVKDGTRVEILPRTSLLAERGSGHLLRCANLRSPGFHWGSDDPLSDPRQIVKPGSLAMRRERRGWRGWRDLMRRPRSS